MSPMKVLRLLVVVPRGDPDPARLAQDVGVVEAYLLEGIRITRVESVGVFEFVLELVFLAL